MNMDFDTMRDTMTAAAEPEDYTGADGLLYCGKCRKPKESYFSEGKTRPAPGRVRLPAENPGRTAGRRGTPPPP